MSDREALVLVNGRYVGSVCTRRSGHNDLAIARYQLFSGRWNTLVGQDEYARPLDAPEQWGIDENRALYLLTGCDWHDGWYRGLCHLARFNAASSDLDEVREVVGDMLEERGLLRSVYVGPAQQRMRKVALYPRLKHHRLANVGVPIGGWEDEHGRFVRRYESQDRRRRNSSSAIYGQACTFQVRRCAHYYTYVSHMRWSGPILERPTRPVQESASAVDRVMEAWREAREGTQ